MKVLQINTTVNTGSTGRIAEDIGRVLISKGHESYIAYGRAEQPSLSETFRIGNQLSVLWHVLITRLFDKHGFASRNATRKLVKWIRHINPDIIHLHCIHGYYIDVKVLFSFIEESQIPVVWTFHDAWAFTGHCTYFDFVNCYKWRVQCNKCPNLNAYPESYFYDNSKFNYIEKKQLFNQVNRMIIVSPSRWLGDFSNESFLSNYPVEIIHNGIDLDQFRPSSVAAIIEKYSLIGKHIILGVASVWSQRKGLSDFVKLRETLDSSFCIVLVGLSEDQQKNLPQGIVCINRTESIKELASLYSAADVYVNPTYVDNFPTTNIESLACGTPVITYNTGGSPEAIDVDTGIVVTKGDVNSLKEAIIQVVSTGKDYYTNACRNRALLLFNKTDRYTEYLSIYQKLLNKN